LHTIGGNKSVNNADPWVAKYIFYRISHVAILLVWHSSLLPGAEKSTMADCVVTWGYAQWIPASIVNIS
jgi:hypothetical protein